LWKSPHLSKKPQNQYGRTDKRDQKQLWLAQSQSIFQLPIVLTLDDVFSVFTDFSNLTSCHFGPFFDNFSKNAKTLQTLENACKRQKSPNIGSKTGLNFSKPGKTPSSAPTRSLAYTC